MSIAATSSREQLLDLLAEGVSAAAAREKGAFDKAAGSLPLVLSGAGGLGRRTLAGLRRHGVEPLAFIDNKASSWGSQVEGIPVYSPEEGARLFGESGVFVVTVWGAASKDRMRDRIGRLQQLSCRRVLSFAPLYWKYPDGLLPHYGADLPHKLHQQADAVEAAFELWEDEASRIEYVNQLRWRLYADFDCLAPPVAHPIYFPADLCPLQRDEVFVDCGAYDGDTVRLFLDQCRNQFRKIVAFEPDPANFIRLQESTRLISGDGRDVVTLQAATGARREKVRLMAEGNQSSVIGEGDVEVDCLTLDEASPVPTPTYIKMDIEGAEIDTIAGASSLIRNHAPVLAICCYHRQDHLWRIPLLIHSLNRDYRFFLRAHDVEMWDLVCYAIPKGRLATAANGQ